MSFIANVLVTFEEYEIDRARWQLSWRDETLPLNRKTFDLLLYLVDHANRVVGKDELLRTLWPESFVEESNLTQHIFLLRKALSRHESGTKIIETVPGRGYRFAAIIKEQQPATDRMVISARESITRITLEEEEVDTSELASQGLEVTQPLLSIPFGMRRVYWIAGGFVAAVALCATGWLGWQRWLDHTSGSPIQVMLMPMEGTTGDAVLDKALIQALRMDLAQSPYASVVSTSTVEATLTQMQHKPDEAMTPAIAREVCERSNSQAVLHGNIARFGQRFLLTEEATNCVDGSVLAASKEEATSADDLPQVVDRLAGSLRLKLGESRRSIARFDTPLFAVNTKSLEALKDYSQAMYESDRGNRPEAVALLKQAIASDPGFATAYYSLAVAYLGGGDNSNGKDALFKAYSLRDSASEPARFAIVAFYHSVTTQDLLESDLNARAWTELYPRNVQAWSSLYKAAYDLGRPEEQVTAGTQALYLRPKSQILYDYLAMSQMHSGDVAAARATLDRAIAQNLDGDRIRNTYLELAYLLHDAALIKTQTDWAAAHPQSPFLLASESAIAMAEGRFRDARQLIAQTTAVFRQQGLPGAAENLTQLEGINLMETGDVQEGKRLFQSVSPDMEDGYNLVGLIDVGSIAEASAALHAAQLKYPNGTLWNRYWTPFLQARIGIVTHHPNSAAALLESARPYERRDLSLRRLRGDAYFAQGQIKDAEKEYRDVIAHPELDPTSGDIPFSWLNLGRALAIEGNRPAAMDAYQHFLTLWAHADPDAMYLKQAKQEFATLQTVTLAK
jgi:DNA-binding winged helix-turn-helix (wHTH) protein/tetratricopeptide (TPR) repeat protein